MRHSNLVLNAALQPKFVRFEQVGSTGKLRWWFDMPLRRA
jgi:hypothetical protein